MNLRKYFLLILLTMPFPLFALNVLKSAGPINLVVAQTKNSNGVFTVKLGKIVKGQFFLFHEVVNGKHMVNGNAEFKNISNKNAFVAYYVALKDKNGNLICSANGDLDVSVGSNIHEYASAVMPLPFSQFQFIDSYEIVLYEDTQTIGTE